MKLGMSQACYRWVFYPQLRRDRPEHKSLGRPSPYLQTVQGPADGENPRDWLIERTAGHGFESLYMSSGYLGDEDDVAAFRDGMAASGLELIGGLGLTVAADADEWREANFERCVRDIRAMARAGARFAAAVNDKPDSLNHFTREPSIDEQIERAIANFKSLMPVCEEVGLRLAFENHLDYRISEVVRVVEGVDSPRLGINFDTGNPVAVIEDPLAAARAAAPYAINAHLKDFRIQPATGTGEPRIFWTPLGRGDAPIAEMVEILAAEAPDPTTLSACVEVAPPPEHDPAVWVQASVDWLRENCAEHFPTLEAGA